MISIITPLITTLEKRNRWLEEISLQNFPAKALQVVFVSANEKLLKDIPVTSFSVRTALVGQKDVSLMKNIGIRHASGDLLFILNEDTIFDNGEDLLKLYEFFLENSLVDVAIGYTLLHWVVENKKGEQPHILKSQVLDFSNKFNLCFRRRCIEKGFLFGRYVFSKDLLDELHEFGFHVQKLKWLQLHQKKSMIPLLGSIYLFWQQFHFSLERLAKTHHWQKLIYGLEIFQGILEKNTQWFQKVYRIWKPLAEKKWHQGLMIFQSYLQRAIIHLRALKTRWVPKIKSQLSEKIYVPHLTSSDQKRPNQQMENSEIKKEIRPPKHEPLFVIKKDKDL
ncbi:MAG: hypothetical protein KDD34_07465 [Bdellovibrionales bacterium]|nr:hypothetical protein [Bdellovibrionales bacterium]